MFKKLFRREQKDTKPDGADLKSANKSVGIELTEEDLKHIWGGHSFYCSVTGEYCSDCYCYSKLTDSSTENSCYFRQKMN